MSDYLPEVAWTVRVTSSEYYNPVAWSKPPTTSFYYIVTVEPIDYNDPGVETCAIGDYLIDFAGYVFEVTEIISATAPFQYKVYDVNERELAENYGNAGPYVGRVGYIYRPKNGAIILTQAQLRKLDSSAADIIQPIEKGIIWAHDFWELDEDENIYQLNTGDVIVNRAIEFPIDEDNPDYKEGVLFYDKSKNALSYYNEKEDVTVNMGQEVLIPVYNNTEDTIPNGAVVYPTGSFLCPDGITRHTIDLADAHLFEKSRMVAVVTQELGVEESGYVTRVGSVGGLDTSGLTGILYLSATTPGTFTNDIPDDGSYIIPIGAVKVIDATDGSITVDPKSSALTVEVTDTNGFPPSQRTNTTLSFDNGTRTLTISASSYPFHYYDEGLKYEKTSSDSVQIDDNEGLHLIYYDGDTLTSEFNPGNTEIDIIIRTGCLVAFIYWNETDQEQVFFGDERHGISMSPETHAYLHFTRGAQYLSGLALDNIDTGQSGDLDAHAQFSIGQGLITDEDLKSFFSGNDSASAWTTWNYPIYYLEGAGANLRKRYRTGFPVDTIDGTNTTRLSYNEWTGSVWQRTEVDNNDFVLCHVFAVNSNDPNERIIIIMGQNEYNTTNAARQGANQEISNLLFSLPFAEMVPLATVIYQTGDGKSNAVKAETVTTDTGNDYINWIVTELAQGASPSSHSNLTGLANDDHLQYPLLAGRTGDTLHIDDIAEFTTDAGITFADKIILGDNIQTGANYISYDGDSEGLHFDSSNNAKFTEKIISEGDVELQISHEFLDDEHGLVDSTHDVLIAGYVEYGGSDYYQYGSYPASSGGVIVDSSGNVGIKGLPSGSYAFETTGAGYFSTSLTVGTLAGYIKGTAGLLSAQAVPIPVEDGGTGTSTAFTAGSVIFAGASGVYSQDNANLFWDNANNRLGIGITPSYTVDITGNLRSSSYAKLGGSLYTSNSNYSYHTLTSLLKPNTNNLTVVGTDIVTQANEDFANITSVIGLKVSTSTSGTYATTNAYGLYVTTPTGATNNYAAIFDGTVGIGIASPSLSYKLEVAGSAKFGSNDYVYVGTTGAGIGYIQSAGTNNELAIYTGTSERIRIDDSGNVGINDTTPSYKLDVNGTGRFTGALTLDSTLGFSTAGVTNIDRILDENTLASDSDTALATQQSIKAYVDALTIKDLTDVYSSMSPSTGQLLVYNGLRSPGSWQNLAVGCGGKSLHTRGSGATPVWEDVSRRYSFQEVTNTLATTTVNVYQDTIYRIMIDNSGAPVDINIQPVVSSLTNRAWESTLIISSADAHTDVDFYVGSNEIPAGRWVPSQLTSLSADTIYIVKVTRLPGSSTADVVMEYAVSSSTISSSYINVPSEVIVGSTNGSTATFDVESNVAWTSSESTGWFSISPTTGSAGTTTVTVTTSEAYTTDGFRSGELTITGSGISQVINVRQAGVSSGSYSSDCAAMLWEVCLQYCEDNPTGEPCTGCVSDNTTLIMEC